MGSWVITLLIAMLLLELGSGLQGVLVPLRASELGFPTPLIGALGTVYYAGFVFGCLVLPRTIRRVGHIRCFAALAAIAASTMLVHAMSSSAVVWVVQRATFGFAFAGLMMVVESWLNDGATISTRGRLLSSYMAATWVGVIAGKLLFLPMAGNTVYAFALCSMAISLALVPVVLTNAADPSIPSTGRRDVFALARSAPIGFVGAFAVGTATGSFWTFGPLYAQALSGSDTGVGLFMAACALGGAISQWPIGRLSDRVDRRWVMTGTSLAAGAAGLLLASQTALSLPLLCAMGALFGAAALPIYSLCVAHANDRAEPSAYVDVSSLLLLAFGLGAAFGPLTSSLVIAEFGVGRLFAFTGTIHFAVMVFALYRIMVAEAPPAEERTVFAGHPPMGHGTQAMITLTPAAEEDGRAEDAAGPGGGSRAVERLA
jgi:MFS family permease